VSSQEGLKVTEPVLLAFGDRQYTRSELDALTSGLATMLEQRGVRAGARIALMSSNRPEFVVALRAIWGLGAAVVLMSTSWKRAEVEHALALTQPSHAVGDNAVLADVMPMLHLDEPVTPGLREFDTPDPSSDALFVFSSGTTGLPKAVRHTHGAFAAAVGHWGSALGMTSTDRMQIMTPPSHILGLLNIATALDAGAWIRLHPRFDVDAMLSHIESDRITIEMAVAPIALALAAHPRLESYDLSSLRYVMWCATPVTQSVADAVTERVGVPWVTAYGASELPVISCNSLEGARLDTVGRAVPGVQIRIASTESGEPLSPDEIGEIQVLSPSAMTGYLPDDETHTAFADGWYRTGDIGYLDAEGWLRITDRAKEMIKVRGFQVAPAEIEAVLHGHTAVADCAVFGIPDAVSGEAVVAAVTRSGAVEADELIALVAERLASYKRPSRVVFVPEIPRLPSGKALRRVLKERLWTSV
jgi:acyl-CoA synthetase (AMP-forming)/AMP-acid ligase II